MAISEHVQDIDFRTKEERQKVWKKDFIAWYNSMLISQSLQYDDRVQAKIEMLTAVLWYLLPEDEYKKLTKRSAPSKLTVLKK